MKFNGKTMGAAMMFDYAEAVAYTPQNLTEAEKQQARENIGAAGAVVASAVGETVRFSDAVAAPFQCVKIFGKTMENAGAFAVEGHLTGLYIAEQIADVPIIRHPQNITAKTGAKVYVSIISGTGEYTYLWQYATASAPARFYNAGTTTYPDGFNTPIMGIDVKAARDGCVYRCKVTDADGNEYISNTATLTIDDNATHPIYGTSTYGCVPLFNMTQPFDKFTMHGIPVASGGNYTDENGQEWLANEYNCTTGQYIERLGYIGFYDGDYSEFTGAYLRSDAGEVLYELETPLISNYEDYATSFREVRASAPKSTIFNDGSLPMQVDYIADTKLYIDRKFEELQNAIVAMGANI